MLKPAPIRWQPRLDIRLAAPLFCAFVIAATWLAIMQLTRSEKQLAIAHKVQIDANLSRALQEHVEAMVNTLDQRVRYIKELYEQHPERTRIVDLLGRGVIINHFLTQIGIIDEHGMLLMTDRVPFKPVDVSDREHFRVHVARDTHQLFISKPVLGRSSGKWSIQFTRRINHADGSFGGIVVVSLDPFYFTNMYADVDIGRSGVITLVGADGVVRAQRQAGQATLGENVTAQPWFQRINGSPRADFQDRDANGETWLVSSHRLREYPFYIVLRTRLSEALEDQQARQSRYIVFGWAVTLAVMLFGAYIAWLGHRLQRSRIEAESANRMKSEFLARVSHELHTPLNGIAASAEYIAELTEDEGVLQAAGLIQQSGQRFGEIVGSMLELASIEAGRFELHARPTQLSELLDSICDAHAAAANGKGLAFERDVSQLGRATVDAGRIAIIVGHLVDNAIKFTDSGHVRVKARREDSLLVIDVADTGRGIATADQAGIFDTFRQLDAFKTRTQPGTGLGLALARELTRLLGGRLTIVSALGRGSTFTVRLPVGEEE